MYQSEGKNNIMLASPDNNCCDGGDGCKKLEDNDEDAALISAVFEPIRLPEVRFAPSPTGAVVIEDAGGVRSTPNSLATTPAPPNSARTTTAATTEAAAMTAAIVAIEEDGDARQLLQSPTVRPRRSVRDRQQTPRDALAVQQQKANLYADDEVEEDADEHEEVEDDDIEQYSMHLLIAHKNSLESDCTFLEIPPTDATVVVHADGVQQQNAMDSCHNGSQMSFYDEEEGGIITPLGTLDTQETGEAMLDTARSMVVTVGGTSEHSSTELEQYADGDDYEGESVIIVHRRASSGLSTELINDAMANAIRNVSRASKASATAAEQQQQHGHGEEEKVPKMRHHQQQKRDVFQLELDKRVAAHRLSSASSSSASGTTAGGRDVHVRTPLNDPRTPLKPKAYTAFELEKQEQIRLEIGSTGPSGIRRIVDRFQNKQFTVVQQQEMNNNNNSISITDELEQKQHHLQQHNTTVSVPKVAMPMMRQNSLQMIPAQPPAPSIQIVEEHQRSVADILSQFQQRDFVHPNGAAKKDDKKATPPATRPSNLSRAVGASVWATSNVRNTQPMRDPAPGSLAAIRKSLGSLPTTPTSVGSVSPTPSGGAERNALTTNDNGGTTTVPSPQPQRVPSMPKTVSEFYRLWGAAQAATAAAASDAKSGSGTLPSSIGTGASPFATAAAGNERVTKC